MTGDEPRIKRVECGICETPFTSGTVVEMAKKIARHWNQDHGDELRHTMTPYKTEEFGGEHLHGNEYSYRVVDYYVTAYDVLDTSNGSCGPFAYRFVKNPEGGKYCDDCGAMLENVDGYQEVRDTGWRTVYRCDPCQKQRNIERRREMNQSIDDFTLQRGAPAAEGGSR